MTTAPLAPVDQVEDLFLSLNVDAKMCCRLVELQKNCVIMRAVLCLHH